VVNNNNTACQSPQEAIRVIAPSAYRQLEKEGLVMVGSFYKRGDFAWVQDVRANYVCIHNGELVATVFSTAWEPWQVILHRPEHQLLVKHESFLDPFAAIARAEELIAGAPPHESIGALRPLWKSVP
jgi:hypothetical protein